MSLATRRAPCFPGSSLSKQTYTSEIFSNSFAHSFLNVLAPAVDVTALKPLASKTKRSNSPSQIMIWEGSSFDFRGRKAPGGLLAKQPSWGFRFYVRDLGLA